MADAQEAAFGLVLWLGGVVLAALAATVLLIYVRKRIRGTHTRGHQGFTLEDIRVMRERGGLSEGEYEALRRSAVGLDSPSPREPGA